MLSISVKSLDPRAQEHFELGQKAGDPLYAMELFKQILKHTTNCHDARNPLYENARNAYCKKNALRKIWGHLKLLTTVLLSTLRFTISLKQIDQAICNSPLSKWSYCLLIKFAIENNSNELRLIGFQNLAKILPNNITIQIQLGDAYFDNGQIDKSLKLSEALLKQDPSNPDIMTLIRNAALTIARKNTK